MVTSPESLPLVSAPHEAGQEDWAPWGWAPASISRTPQDEGTSGTSRGHAATVQLRQKPGCLTPGQVRAHPQLGRAERPSAPGSLRGRGCTPLSQAEGSPPLWSPQPLALHPRVHGVPGHASSPGHSPRGLASECRWGDDGPVSWGPLGKKTQGVTALLRRVCGALRGLFSMFLTQRSLPGYTPSPVHADPLTLPPGTGKHPSLSSSPHLPRPQTPGDSRSSQLGCRSSETSSVFKAPSCPPSHSAPLPGETSLRHAGLCQLLPLLADASCRQRHHLPREAPLGS